VTAWNEKKKKRYAQEPEYRKYLQACSRAYYHAHKEERCARVRAHYRAHRDEIVARKRQDRAAGIAKPKSPQAARASRLKHQYGISVADYEALFARQGGACAICKRSGLRCAWIIATSPAGCAVCSAAVATRHSVSCGTIRASWRRRGPISGPPRVPRAVGVRAAPARLAARTRRSARLPGAL
jgi:hypothetical protein